LRFKAIAEEKIAAIGETSWRYSLTHAYFLVRRGQSRGVEKWKSKEVVHSLPASSFAKATAGQEEPAATTCVISPVKSYLWDEPVPKRIAAQLKGRNHNGNSRKRITAFEQGFG
jgi:hypothetical protein